MVKGITLLPGWCRRGDGQSKPGHDESSANDGRTIRTRARAAVQGRGIRRSPPRRDPAALGHICLSGGAVVRVCGSYGASTCSGEPWDPKAYVSPSSQMRLLAPFSPRSRVSLSLALAPPSGSPSASADSFSSRLSPRRPGWVGLGYAQICIQGCGIHPSIPTDTRSTPRVSLYAECGTKPARTAPANPIAAGPSPPSPHPPPSCTPHTLCMVDTHSHRLLLQYSGTGVAAYVRVYVHGE